jgi:hypothetical protein
MTNKTSEELQGKIRALEEELSELERKVENIYTPLIALTNEALFLVDMECTHLFITENMAINFNTPVHEIIGKKYGDFHKPDVTRVFEEKVAEVIPFDRIAVNMVNMKDYTRTIRYVKGDRFSGNRIGDIHSLAGRRLNRP